MNRPTVAAERVIIGLLGRSVVPHLARLMSDGFTSLMPSASWFGRMYLLAAIRWSGTLGNVELPSRMTAATSRHAGVLWLLAFSGAGWSWPWRAYRVEDLSYGYPGHAVGQHVDLQSLPGEVLACSEQWRRQLSNCSDDPRLLPPLAGAVRVDGEADFELECREGGNELRVCCRRAADALPV